MIIHGVNQSIIAKPITVDENGNIVVSGIELTSDGSKLPISATGELLVINYPHAFHYSADVTQFLKYGEAVNATTTIYTVPASRDAFLTSIFAHISNASAVGAAVTVEIHDNTPSKIMEWKLAAVANALNVMSVSFAVPVRLRAGYTVKLVSTAALQYIRGSITGYEYAY